jgi:hypothetical protein
MKKILLLIIGAATCGLFLFWRLNESGPVTESTKNSVRLERDEADREDGIKEAMKMEFEMTKDVSLGYVPKTRLTKAVNDLIVARRKGNNRVARINSLSWIERGPNTDAIGVSNANTRGTANGATSGRIRAIWVDLADATHHTVWIGGVDGGIWKTSDISGSPASWTPVNDFLSNLAVSSICQSPADHNIMYFGTGEKAQSSFFLVQGGGVWKSTDHGTNWSLLSSTSSFFNVSKLLCDAAGNVYVSVVPSIFGLGSTGGIYRSSDGGSTWTNITPSGLSSNVTDMKLSSTGRLHIVCGYSSNGSSPDPAPGYRYTDNPSTVTSAGWTAATGFPSPQFNCELAVSANTLYALNSNSSFQTPVIYKSTDGGATWASTATSPPASGGTNDLSSGQAWYNMEATVDPANGNNVIVGGLNCYRSTDGGATWNQASVWVGSTGEYIHADQHTGVWNGSQVLIGCDGGIFYSADGGATWSDRNTGLRLKQFYSCAIHPTTTNYFLAGAQDNGTHQLTNAGLGGSIEVEGGDGAFVHIDQDEPQYQFCSYVYSQYRRSTDGGNTWSDVDYSSSVGQFINPTDYDDGNNKMYTGGAAGQYVRWDDPQTGASFTPVSVAAFGSKTVRSIVVSPYTSNRVFFGTAGGRVVKVDNANNNSPTGTNITGTGMPTTIVSCVAVGTDDNNLIATYSNYGSQHVWVSTTGGGSGGWTNISGDLPDIPVRWAMFYPDDNTKAIIATEMGVFETSLINGSSTVWTADPNFPTVLTAMLQYRSSDGTLAAATHGRGLWTTTIPHTTPAIRFSSAYRSQSEANDASSGCRNYKDYTVDMTIDAAPVGDANVTVSVAGGATATQGVDFDFTTNGSFSSPSSTITFLNGSSSSKTITIRVYDDADIEGAESFTLDYTLSGTTNAVAAPCLQTYSFTINDNDQAPVVPFTGSFTVGTYDANLSGSTPFRSDLQKHRLQALFTAAELSAAGISGATNITSMNLRVATKNSTKAYSGFTISMINSSAADLSTGFESGTFTQVYSGNYSTVAGNNTFNFSTPFAWDGTSNVVVQLCFDNSPNPADASADVTEGNSAPLGASLYPTCYANGGASSGCSLAAAFISNFRINATFGASSGNQIETVLNSNRTEYTASSGTYYFYSPGSKILNSISGASATLGCVTSNILEAGNTWQTFLAGQRSQKVVTITPTTNSGSSYTVGLYYTAAELGGKTPSALKIAKTTAATMASADGSNTLLGNTTVTSYGSGYLFTASFTGFSNFFLVDANVILPVTLINFEGHLNNNTAILNWTTSAEYNSKNFDIEKSTDGVNYYKIGSVSAAGNSADKKEYSFTDTKLAENNYYRLRMNDNDGRYKLSQIVLIRYSNAKQNVWVVNNPFSNYIDLRFAKLGSRAKLQLINMNGAVVTETILSSPSGQIRWNLPAHLSNGSYIIKSTIDGEQFTSKVVKR